MIQPHSAPFASRRQCLMLLATLALSAGCGPQSGPGQAELIDIDGNSHGSLAKSARGRWSSLFFVGTDCPISNRYAPEIKRICGAYAHAGVQCLLVYSDPHYTIGQIRAHAGDFGYTLPVIFDRDRQLVTRLGATSTPEVAVIGPGAMLAYRGRIDNLHAELGRPRQQATEHDLRDALDDLVEGRPVRKPRTFAVGCYIE
jgi:hypothetical protein